MEFNKIINEEIQLRERIQLKEYIEQFLEIEKIVLNKCEILKIITLDSDNFKKIECNLLYKILSMIGGFENQFIFMKTYCYYNDNLNFHEIKKNLHYYKTEKDGFEHKINELNKLIDEVIGVCVDAQLKKLVK